MHDSAIGIVAAGTYIPESYIAAAEIAAQTGIPAAVIQAKFGLDRKPVPGRDDHTNAMALWAAQDALTQTDIPASEIDVVLCTTEEWKEYPLWTAGIKLAHDLGANRAWAIDVQMRCATTIGALKLAAALMQSDPAVGTMLIAGGYRNGDLVDYGNPRTRFLTNLSAGGGALLLRRGWGRNRLLGSALRVDGAFSLDVIVPTGGTMAPATGPLYLDVPDPEGMKARLDDLSMRNFIAVIDEALAASGCTRAEIGYLNILHMKRSAHEFVLRELGLRDDQTVYLSDYGHIGQQDAMVSIKEGLAKGRLRDGELMVIVAAGIGYAWGASVVRWGQA
ncbi:MAG TPA: 3-oxoacyl-ACP synthase [Chloroflexia bacterium]|nr:3-oxoacyl-ACP synthase [Chloroflexia bacterium]